MRALAAVELLELTNEEQYAVAFESSSWLGTGQGDPGAELDALFAYARLPKGLGDAVANNVPQHGLKKRLK